MPVVEGEIAYPSSTVTRKVQFLGGSGKIVEHSLPQETSFVDKKILVQQLAGFFLLRLLQAKKHRETSVRKKLKDQNNRLLPEQIAYEQQTLV